MIFCVTAFRRDHTLDSEEPDVPNAACDDRGCPSPHPAHSRDGNVLECKVESFHRAFVESAGTTMSEQSTATSFAPPLPSLLASWRS